MIKAASRIGLATAAAGVLTAGTLALGTAPAAADACAYRLATGACAGTGPDRDCGDFSSAERPIVRTGPADPWQLDRDDDMIACETGATGTPWKPPTPTSPSPTASPTRTASPKPTRSATRSPAATSSPSATTGAGHGAGFSPSASPVAQAQDLAEDELPVTGAKLLGVAAGGGVVLAGGAALVVAARRRRIRFTA